MPDHEWTDALNRAIDALAGLTAVDGATIMTDRHEQLAFGAKIGRREGGTQVEQIVVTEPVEGSTAEWMHPGRLGGTRHLSAAQFVQDQHDAQALVASQDGRFTILRLVALRRRRPRPSRGSAPTLIVIGVRPHLCEWGQTPLTERIKALSRVVYGV